MRFYSPLDELAGRGMRLGLEGMRALLSGLERPDPHRAFPSLLIAGSNGKGSTAAAIASGLRHCGLRVGLATSPHLVSVNERIQINGLPISDEEFIRLFERLRPSFEVCRTTYFEALMAMSFIHFAEMGVDAAVVEVGMGGRYDASNLLEASVYVFTEIALEHTQYLGTTLPAIASEKAAVLKETDAFGRIPEAVILQQPREVMAVFEAAAQEKRVPLHVLEPAGRSFRERALQLAEEAVKCFERVTGSRLDPADLSAGIKNSSWPGRFHRLERPGRPLLVIDGAHNPAGAEALADLFQKEFPNRRAVVVSSILRDKEVSGILANLSRIAERFVFTRVRSAGDRAMDPALYRVEYPFEIEEDPLEALRRAEELAGKDGIVLAAGSLYLAGELFACLGIDPFSLKKED